MRTLLALTLGFGLVSLSACGDGTSAKDGSDSDGDGDGESGDGTGDDGEAVCEDEWVDKDPDTMEEDLQQKWGAACTTNEDCVDLLGFDNALCVTDILSIYTPPGGYCSRPCDLPSSDVLYVDDAADCDPDGGVTCLGAMGVFTQCAKTCTSHDQCSREGYACILMPSLGSEGEPKFCLMNPDACCIAGDACP